MAGWFDGNLIGPLTVWVCANYIFLLKTFGGE